MTHDVKQISVIVARLPAHIKDVGFIHTWVKFVMQILLSQKIPSV